MTSTNRTVARPPLWRDTRFLSVVFQLVAVAVAVAIVYVLWFNLTNNMRAAGLDTDFSFLSQPIGVNIPGSDLSSGAVIWRGLMVGIRNTLALVVVGLPLLTILGVIIGIARLSTNWLVAKIAGLYVELFRNLPPLLIIFFMYSAVFLRLPELEASANPLGLFIINNRFVAVPSLLAEAGLGLFWLIAGLGLMGATAVWIWRTRVFDRTGEPHHRVLWALGVLMPVVVVAYLLLDYPIVVEVPMLEGRALVSGYSGLVAYFAALIGLVLYTASHVAEIVRGSILAVPRGQTEAANAVALTSLQRLRFVILPQAMRIAIPPVISQYLNFTKKTTLAIAIGYAEVTRIAFQAIGNGQPAPQLVLVLMSIFLVFSLIISAMVNIVNRRLQLVTL